VKTWSRLAAPLALASLTGACTERLAPPEPAIDSVMTLRSFDLNPVALDPFHASGAALERETGITVRAGRFTPPKGVGWSGWLHDSFAAQLGAVGRLDPGSPIHIGATLVENRSGDGFTDGRAVLAARFIVTRDGVVVYDRVQRADIDWRNSFIGILAYEAAYRHYTALYPKLLETLFADPDFRAAVRRSPAGV
jgi:hypothetical protein